MNRAAVASLTLVDGALAIPIRPQVATADDPIACRQWDLGAPEVRVTSTTRASMDGTDEGAGYFGSRTVTLDLIIRGDRAGIPGGHDPYWYADQLAGMCHPSRRPVLKITRNSEASAGTDWFLTLRGNPWSLAYERASAARLEMTLTFTAPTGYLESELHELSTRTSNTNAATDWHFPMPFPHGFGQADGSPILTVNVVGSGITSPVFYIAGPVTDPLLTDNLGNRFEFSGLKLLSGETVQIDMGAGTVLKTSPATGVTSPADNVFHTVDFAKSTFWQWYPGVHLVALRSSSGSLAVQWRDRKLTI